MSQGNANSFETLSMLSPRNLMRLLSNGIDEIRKFAVETPQALEEHAKEFHSYLSSFQGEYDRYKQQQSKQTVTSTQDAREELQIELKINRIPA